MTDLAHAAAVAAKDLRSELRNRAASVATLFFSGLTLVVLAFALGRQQALLEQAAPGALWVALAFSGVIAAAQSFGDDLQEGALDALLTLPVARAAVYLGKLAAVWATLGALALVLLPATLVLYGAPVTSGLPVLLATLALGTLGFAVVATFYAALTANLRARESLLPVLMFPIVVPVLLAAVRATEAVLHAGDAALAGAWVQLLAGFDLVYLVVACALFHVVVEE